MVHLTWFGSLLLPQGNIFQVAAEQVQQGSGPYAFITLSNVLEFAPSFEAAVASVKGLVEVLQPGAAVMLRTCLHNTHSAGNQLGSVTTSVH